MMNILIILALFSSYLPDITGTYYRHRQVCSVDNAWDKKWELALKQDSSFIYSIREQLTLRRKDSTYTAKGNWTISHDTITLKTYTYPYLYEFVVKDDMLIPIGEKEEIKDGLIMNLDCLMKR